MTECRKYLILENYPLGYIKIEGLNLIGGLENGFQMTPNEGLKSIVKWFHPKKFKRFAIMDFEIPCSNPPNPLKLCSHNAYKLVVFSY